MQQRASTSPNQADRARLEGEAELAASHGPAIALSSVGATVLCEPTYPRRTTGNRMIQEAERILATSRDQSAADETTRLWSRVESNFAGSMTTGKIARRIWTNIFLRHFTEPNTRPGVESAHPRYFYSRPYGWVDAQHFFGFIDFAEREAATHPGDRQGTLQAATSRGSQIEARQQLIRDWATTRPPESVPPALRALQVRPPNTALFRTPQPLVGIPAQIAGQMAEGAVTGTAQGVISGLSPWLLEGTERELFDQLQGSRRDKFFQDASKSAWSYEDIVSNQLGTRFHLAHAAAVDSANPAARDSVFLAELSAFFGEIAVENDPGRLDEIARDLPQQERDYPPRTTEQRERQRHPDLFQLPRP